MDWIERPANAGESWPADELRLHPMGIVVALRSTGGETGAGVLRHVTADMLELDVDEGAIEVDVRAVAAFAIVSR